MCNPVGTANPWGAFDSMNRINQMTKHLIKNKDTNNDNVLSMEESGVSEATFAKVDRNGDGQADKKEINMSLAANRINDKTTKMIMDKDSNGDGFLSIEESGVSEAMFAKIDRNGDGQADKKEINMSQAAKLLFHKSINLINEKDANDDGLLNIEESGVSEETFAAVDRNGDGQVDRKEISKYQHANPIDVNTAYQPQSNEESAASVDVSV